MAHQAERVKWGEQMDRLRTELAAAEGEALKVKLLEQELAAAKDAQQDEKKASLQVVKLQNALDVANALRTNASLIKLQQITVGTQRPASQLLTSEQILLGTGGVSNAQLAADGAALSVDIAGINNVNIQGLASQFEAASAASAASSTKINAEIAALNAQLATLRANVTATPTLQQTGATVLQ
jgi:hypothetical protein